MLHHSHNCVVNVRLQLAANKNKAWTQGHYYYNLHTILMLLLIQCKLVGIMF